MIYLIFILHALSMGLAVYTGYLWGKKHALETFLKNHEKWFDDTCKKMVPIVIEKAKEEIRKKYPSISLDQN